MNINSDLTKYFCGFKGLKVENIEQSNFLLICSKQKGFIIHEFDVRTFEKKPIYYINTYNARLEAVKNIAALILTKLKLQYRSIKRSLYFSVINITDELPDKIENIFSDFGSNLFFSKKQETKIEIPTFRSLFRVIGISIIFILAIQVCAQIGYRVIFGHWFIVEFLKELN